MKKAIILVNIGFGEYNGADRLREKRGRQNASSVLGIRL
jgi:hypothetical protein